MGDRCPPKVERRNLSRRRRLVSIHAPARRYLSVLSSSLRFNPWGQFVPESTRTQQPSVWRFNPWELTSEGSRQVIGILPSFQSMGDQSLPKAPRLGFVFCCFNPWETNCLPKVPAIWTLRRPRFNPWGTFPPKANLGRGSWLGERVVSIHGRRTVSLKMDLRQCPACFNPWKVEPSPKVQIASFTR